MTKVLVDASSEQIESNSDSSCSDLESEKSEDDDEEDYDIRYYKRRKEKRLQVIYDEECKAVSNNFGLGRSLHKIGKTKSLNLPVMPSKLPKQLYSLHSEVIQGQFPK